ncbi:MAG: hypothetical protein INR69_09900 [Mucilaginibacter polytrichastri]|nr:hypothetical protein [Mucilaginibacter polytrichastri]
MRTLINLMLCFGLLAIAGCDKDTPGTGTLRGKWELSSETSGMTGKNTTFPSGNGSILQFGEKTYEVYTGGKQTKSGTYTLNREKSILTGENGNRIIYDGVSDGIRTFFRVDDEGLHIWIDAYDAPSSTYRKVE